MYSSLVFLARLTALCVAVSSDELPNSENCDANATHSEDGVARGSPLMQKALAKVISSHRDKREDIKIESFVLDDNGNRGQWEAIWDMDVTGLTMLDPIRPNDLMLNDLLKDGAISRRYRSWYMPLGPDGPEDNKFYHEVGVGLAHRNAWKNLIDRANGDNKHWGLIFEGDAVLRADFWRWIRHLRDEVLSKENAPAMIWLGQCYDKCYYPNHPDWRDGDMCFTGDEADNFVHDHEMKGPDRFDVHNNPYNVSGCILHFVEALCPTAYLISLEAAKKMMDATKQLECAIDEKLRYEIQINNMDVRIMCTSLAKQPWQPELNDAFKDAKVQVAKEKRAAWVQEVERGHRKHDVEKQRMHGNGPEGKGPAASICAPPRDNVKFIEQWPPQRNQ